MPTGWQASEDNDPCDGRWCCTARNAVTSHRAAIGKLHIFRQTTSPGCFLAGYVNYAKKWFSKFNLYFDITGQQLPLVIGFFADYALEELLKVCLWVDLVEPAYIIRTHLIMVNYSARVYLTQRHWGHGWITRILVHWCTGKYQENLRDQRDQRANLHTEYFPHADSADSADPYIIDVLKIRGNLWEFSHGWLFYFTQITQIIHAWMVGYISHREHGRHGMIDHSEKYIWPFENIIHNYIHNITTVPLRF